MTEEQSKQKNGQAAGNSFTFGNVAGDANVVSGDQTVDRSNNKTEIGGNVDKLDNSQNQTVDTGGGDIHGGLNQASGGASVSLREVADNAIQDVLSAAATVAPKIPDATPGAVSDQAPVDLPDPTPSGMTDVSQVSLSDFEDDLSDHPVNVSKQVSRYSSMSEAELDAVPAEERKSFSKSIASALAKTAPFAKSAIGGACTIAAPALKALKDDPPWYIGVALGVIEGVQNLIKGE